MGRIKSPKVKPVKNNDEDEEQIVIVTRSCEVCKEPDTEEMVYCDDCSLLSHFTCAGVDATVANRPWSCQVCVNLKIKMKNPNDAFRSSPIINKSQTTTPVNTKQPETRKPESGNLTASQSSKATKDEMEKLKSALKKSEADKQNALSIAKEYHAKFQKAKTDCLATAAMTEKASEAMELAAKEKDELKNKVAMQEKELMELRNKLARTSPTIERAHVENSEQSFVPPQQEPRLNVVDDLEVLRQSLLLDFSDTAVEESPRKKRTTFINDLAIAVASVLKTKSPSSAPVSVHHSQAYPRAARTESVSNMSIFDESIARAHQSEELPIIEKMVTNMGRKFLAKLPDFSGDVKEWPLFESIYETTTKEGGYSDSDNFNRLKLVLKGTALKQVHGLFVNCGTAEQIMRVLKQRFGKAELIVGVFTKSLLKFPKMSNKIDSKLLDLSIEVNNFVAVMERRGLHSELSNIYLMYQLEQKLEFDHQREWNKEKAQNKANGINSTIKELSLFMTERAKEIPFDLTGEPSKSAHSNDKPRRLNTHQLANESKGKFQGSSGISCYKCSGNHPMYRCEDFQRLNVRERFTFVKDNKICSACIRSKNHTWKDCPTKRKCVKEGCNQHHHPLLHYNKSYQNNLRAAPQQSITQRSANPNDPSQTSNAFTDMATTNSVLSAQANAFQHNAHRSKENIEEVLFKILPVRIYGVNASFIDTFAFLDDGSSLTLVDKDIYDSLSLEGTHEQLNLQWTKGITRIENSHRTSFAISGVKGKKKHVLTNVYAVENLDLPEQTVNVAALKSMYPHLKGLPLSSYENGKPKILIGLQHSKLLLGTVNHSGGDDDPIASKTRLGWTVFGKAAQSMGIIALTHHKHSGVQLSIQESTIKDDDLHRLVKGYFTTENFGVMTPKRDLISEENERALKIMNRSLKKVEGRYEIGLLWRKDNIKLPDSYPMAFNRLLTLERSLKRKPDLLAWKNNHVKELLEKGYARKATKQELEHNWPRVWYCPTFIVVNPNKLPPKPRDVADVAAKVHGQSLNSNLLKGPDNMAPLFSGLFKFRENAIAVNADVKEMFHQIAITEEDQQCQRFLYRDGDDSQEPQIYVMQRMMFGPTCSPSCAQFVKNTHASKYLDKMPEAATALIKFTYVDDYFNSHKTVEEALKVTNEAFNICDNMGFDLLGVQSNSLDLLKRLPKVKVKSSLVSIDSQSSEVYVAKVLGMYWQSFPDFFTYKICRDELVKKMLSDDFVPSKREILRTLMRTFDPLGLIALYLIRGKIVLQEIWREGTGWDEPIPENLLQRWQDFMQELPNIEMLKIPRQYGNVVPSESQVSLIIFVDASEQAFAATAYFRFQTSQQVEVAQVMAKAKVAPIKRLTIPQLELQAAVLGVRLAKTIKDLHAFTIQETRFMSDSKVVLAWICSKKYNFKTFVAARIGEILDTTSRKEWFHVGTKDNVADDATKWSDPTIGDSSSRWFKGPDFLRQEISRWPVKPAVECDEDDETVKHTQLMIHTYHKSTNKLYDHIENIGARFKSRWTSLVRVIAYTARFIDRTLHKKVTTENCITPEEFLQAEMTLFRKIQQDVFSIESATLQAGEDSVSSTSKIFQFCPFIKEGLLRMNSRAQKANISYAAKCPIILPNKHELVDIFVQHIHEKNLHMGEEMTIADIRSRVWVINTRSAVQRVKRNCQWCKNQKAQPKMPLMGELPLARVDFGVKPFTHVGLDAFGPYQVKYGRGNIKRYGLIFTCLTYRAVHLEVLNDMTTDACIMAIRRFLVRRGWSQHFYSDNGKNFVGARNLLHNDLAVLKDSLGPAVVKKYGITWSFQPAYSPWWGGAWERLIQSIKKCIEFVMKNESPREDIFQNSLIEAEFWMNRRPLTHSPISHDDASPLTPNSVLYGDEQDNLATSIGIFTVNDAHSRKGYRRVQHLVSKYLSRWTKEYLPSINRRSKWYEKTNPVKVGDIVILTNPTEPKGAWKKGRIVKVNPGADAIVRSVDVQLSDRTIKQNRPVGRIAVLDVGV